MFPRAAEVPIIRTCSLPLAALALGWALPAAANPALPGDFALTYVQARAASISGDHERSAALLGALAEANPSDQALARRALSAAIGAGQMELAVQLAGRVPPEQLGVDGRLLLVADAVKRGRSDQALPILHAKSAQGNITFLDPLLRAWNGADRRDLPAALAALQGAGTNPLARQYAAETRAFILTRFGRTSDAEPFARTAILGAGPRAVRLRLALADSFLKAGDGKRAAAMVDGIGVAGEAAAERIRAGRSTGHAIDSAAEALGEILLGVASDLSRVRETTPPLGIAQVARFAAPGNSGAAVLLALLLEAEDREGDALAVLRSVPPDDPLAEQALDTRSRLLMATERGPDALALARAGVERDGAGVADWSRLGDVLRETERFDEASSAYSRAIALAAPRGQRDELWPLYLLQATSFEQANRWPEAKAALQAGLKVAPEQPLLLNFLGYSKLERGEDLDSAEAMIRKAVALAPDDASITDSLGWALYKRGKIDDAVKTLERAAAGDPTQAEIQEHLGDALFAAGRRYEARFAWNAALLTAEDDMVARIRAKLAAGLTPATAAP